MSETAIKKIFSVRRFDASSIYHTDHVFIYSYNIPSVLSQIERIDFSLHRISNLSLTQKNVVVLDPENVVVKNGQNVVGGLGSDRKNVVDLSGNVGQNVVEINQEQSPYPSAGVGESSPKRQWTAVKASHEMAMKKPSCLVMARLYNEARTYFQSQA